MFFEGKTLLSAASYLSINDYRHCIETLVRSQELYLAYYISFALYPEALEEISIKLAERAERYFQVDVCMSLYQNHIKDEELRQIVTNRLMRTGLIKKDSNQMQLD